ncbi:MAG: sensor histidine kinase [Anaerolineae bacterium]|nr:sensor histidine kinase [Anaerolineae bacterium]
MPSEAPFPLPRRQYRWYILFFNVLMFGSLAGALVMTLWDTGAGVGWQELITVFLLVGQAGIYLGIILLAPGWPVSTRLLLFYFGACLAMWAVETWLTPEIWWLGFAYIGQMFGLLPLVGAIAGTVFVSLVMYWFFMTQTDLGTTGAGMLYGMAAQWISILAIFVFLNQLIRTSQERGKLIAELEAAKRALELAQVREAELAVLRERERLARDLHDSLGHALVALSVQLEAVQRLYRVDPERASAQVDELKVLTRGSMDALRRSIAGLRAPGLGERDLRTALQLLCVDFGQRTGIAVDCDLDAVTDKLNPALAETVWRVTQEALTNVEKHAQAQHVAVCLAHEPGLVMMRVTDDGVGFRSGFQPAPGHFGLRGMRERVEGMGGTLRLDDAGGAVIEARLPLISGQ